MTPTPGMPQQDDDDALFGEYVGVPHKSHHDDLSSSSYQTDSVTLPSGGSTATLVHSHRHSFSYEASERELLLPTDVSMVAPFSLWNSTRQQKLLLLALALVDLTSNMCLSVLAPFFPDEVCIDPS